MCLLATQQSAIMTSALEHTHTGAQIGVNTLQYCQKAPMVRNKFDVYRSVQLQTQFRDFRCGTKNGLLLLLFNKIPVNTFAIVVDRSGAGWRCRFFYTFFLFNSTLHRIISYVCLSFSVAIVNCMMSGKNRAGETPIPNTIAFQSLNNMQLAFS